MTEKRVLVFGGTIEGRQVSDYLNENKIYHTLCVATEYGEEVLTPQKYLEIHQGRMDVEAMCRFMQEGAFCAVVDATHPYAVEVSKNVRSTCEKTGVPYLRYLRPRAEFGQGSCCGGAALDGAGNVLMQSGPGKTVIQRRDGAAVTQIGVGNTAASDKCIYVNSTREAAQYLETQEGQIFLTTGSKELHVFTECISDKSRLFARVLPSAEVIASCRALGLEGKQICGMQGPFSADMNEAMMRQAGSAFLVTKDTGTSGGFPEKIEAAKRLGVQTVIIRRPEEAGYNWEEITQRLGKILVENATDVSCDEAEAVTAYKAQDDKVQVALAEPGKMQDEKEQVTSAELEKMQDDKVQVALTEPGKMQDDKVQATSAELEKVQDDKMQTTSAEPEKARRISCIGIGMGTLDTLTHEAAQVIRSADILFGAKRILESVQAMEGVVSPSAVAVAEYSGVKIAEYLAANPQYRNIVILMSGDVGFYSGARGIQSAFPKEQVQYYCGISSVIYFASRIPTAWQDAKLISAHGKHVAVLNFVNRYPKLILLVSGKEDVERICGELNEAGQSHVRVTVGTNLSYQEETIRRGSPMDFLKCDTTGLHIMMLENPEAFHVITPGIPDESFVRGKVPMTKEEIRILSVAKLRLTEDAVVYDVGAGTGSVSIEAARLCTAGTVYAIERNHEGIELIRENSRNMCLSNIVTVEGVAPEALAELPAPTHAFIGGSSGNMKQIVQLLLSKNPGVRIVLNTIALESIAEVMKIIEELEIADADIVQVSAAKSKTLGRYHMMNALNPVYIVSFGGIVTVHGHL